MRFNRKTKIIATIGPVSCGCAIIKKLFLAGVNVFRLNFSHGDHEFHRNNARMIRQIEQELAMPVAIMMDLQGPKIRIGMFEEGKVALKAGAKFVFDLDKSFGNARRVTLPHPEIFSALSINSDILIDDGKILLRVLQNDGEKIETEVINGGIISNKKGVNLPNVILPISAITTKDQNDLAIIQDIDANWLAVSFVQKAEDILEARKFVDNDVQIIAKIEKPCAIENIMALLEVSDAIMVARGDLGVEVPFENLPEIQRNLIKIAKENRKLVIVATQMLESMTKCHMPTRAEITDVECAVRQGADAIMLSAETAAGDFPEDAVKVMAKIAKCAENNFFNSADKTHCFFEKNFQTAIAQSAKAIVLEQQISKIVIFTDSGKMIIDVANARINAKIVALTPNIKTLQKLALVSGVCAILVEEIYTFSQMIRLAKQKILEYFELATDEKILIIARMPFRQDEEANFLYILNINEDEDKKIFDAV